MIFACFFSVNVFAKNDVNAAYQEHAQNTGAVTWVSDGAIAGTTDTDLPIQAIGIRIVSNSLEIIHPTSVTLNKTTVSLGVGESDTLTARVMPANATNKGVSWSSSDMKRVSVDSYGKITAYDTGKAVIKATTVDGHFISSCTVMVNNQTNPTPGIIHPSSVSLNKTTGILNVGMSDILIATVLPENTTNKGIAWTSSDPGIATVDNTGKVTAVSSGNVTIIATTVDGSLTGSCAYIVNQPAPNVSRIEWVTNLVASLGYEIGIADDELLLSFADVIDVDTVKILNAAVIYGILPYDASGGIPLFEPNNPATREFAAMTAVNGLGFSESADVLNCIDANTLVYPNQDAVAVSIGLMQLQNQAFNPSGSIGLNEMEVLLAKIKSINDPPEIDENYNNVVTYADGVKNLPSVTNYTATDGNTVVTVPVNDATKDLKVNDVFVLPVTAEHPSGISMKIIEISKEGSVFVLKCIKPENMQEIVKDVDVEGYGIADIDNITVAEGVEYSYIEDEAADVELSTLGNINGGGTVAVPGKIQFKVKKEIYPKVNLEGTVKVSIPAIKYKVNADFGLFGNSLNDLYLAIDSKEEVEGAIKYSAVPGTLNQEGSIELGRVPVPLGSTGLSVDLVVWVGYSAQGVASVTYTLEQTNGIQVINNNLRMIKDAKISREVKPFEASFKVGPKLSLTLTFFEAVDLVDFTIDGGLGIKAGVIIRPTGMVCVDGTVYFYLELSAGKNSALGQVFGLEYENEIFDENNSPYKLKLHVENGTPVPKCTYGKGTLAGSVATATNRTNFIPNARVAVYSGNNLVKTLYSDSSGKYSAQLDDGSYTINVSASGYIPFDCDTTVKTDETTFVETLLMVAGDPGQLGIAGGIITDSVTGGTVADVELTVRKGWNKASGTTIQTGRTDASGNYRLSLPQGNYTIEMKKAGYTTSYLNIIAQGPH